MTNQRYITHIELQFANLNKSFSTLVHHLTVDDNSRARLEMELVMNVITQLYDTISNLENIGRQPEETQTENNMKNYSDCILVTLK
jgi:hypothetical protein